MRYSQVKKAIKESDKDTVRGVLDDYNEEVLEAALECGISISNVAEAYQGEFRNDAVFVQQLLEGMREIPELPHYVYIDWDMTAKDVMLDYCKYNGHYFRNI